MIEYTYDEKKFRKMAVRTVAVAYAIMFAIVVAFAGLSMYFVARNNETSTTLVAAGFVGIFVVVLIIMVISAVRKQLSKSFAMLSANGIVHEQVVVTDTEIVITNVTLQNVNKMPRSSIASVKKYKDFFVVIANTKAKWLVPLNEHTNSLYEELTGKSNALTAGGTKDVVAPSDTNKESDVKAAPADVLSFEYELTENQAISMLTKVLTVRFRIVLAAAIVTTVFSAGYLTVMAICRLTGTEMHGSPIFVPIVTAMFAVFFWFCYGLRGKSGKTNGQNYFNSNAKDGVFLQRIELYDQGIVIVNVLRDTRTHFRISDMDSIRLCDNFFYVEFKSKNVLPVPLTDDTRGLLDILKQCVTCKKG